MSYVKSYTNCVPPVTQNLDDTTAAVYRKMYIWMACGLAVTAFTALIIIQQLSCSSAFAEIYLSKLTMWGLLIVSIGMVFFLNALINKMSFFQASFMFLLYSVVMGAWIAPVITIYTQASVFKVFLIAAGTFGGMAFYGHTTKKDLSTVGRICFMALWGVILASIVNIFLQSPAMDYIMSYIAVALFCGLTMYDVQKMKSFILGYGNTADDNVRKIALLGALSLYLDFINLFLALLRIMGKRK